MSALSDYVTGQINLTNGSAAFTGTGTAWLTAGFREGDEIKQVEGQTQWEAMIATIIDNTHGTLVRPWGGATGTYDYRLRYMADGARMGAQARNLIELIGDGTLLSLAGLAGPGVIELLPGGGAQVVPKADLINGVAVDKRLNTMDDRDAYDSQADQFSVYIADVGDAFGPENAGRAATFFREGATPGVWSDPAYVTGPVGPPPNIEIGDTDTLPPGSAATVTPTPISGGVSLAFGIPAGRGPVPKGTYNPVTAYLLDDAVLDNGSTWTALQATTGHAPPTLPTTSNAYWQLLARKGTDGTGTGDVVGPAGATDGRLALFDGTTGKLLKAGGPPVTTGKAIAMAIVFGG